MTTSTRPVPLLVPDSDSGVRCPSDVFTGDGRRTLTKTEWELLFETTYGRRET